ncbi:MAG: DUF4199 family protein [Bacteroidetes bacterium]|jgi:hypothetical protein|nr:DUF4199 family protein [Bacteroidota bacterium]
MTNDVDKQQLLKKEILYGILLFLGFLLYFFIMKETELYAEFNLRILNIVIHAAIIYLAIRSYYRSADTESVNYIDGTMAGIRPGAIGVILFCIFQIIYLHIDENLMSSLNENSMAGSYLNPFTASAILLFEGFAVTVVLSYITMRIVDSQFKKKYIPSEKE